MTDKTTEPSDVKRSRASHHSQKQNYALLWKFVLMMAQNEREQSFPDLIEQPFLFLFPGKNDIKITKVLIRWMEFNIVTNNTISHQFFVFILVYGFSSIAFSHVLHHVANICYIPSIHICFEMPKKASWLSFVTFFRKIHQQETK